MSERENKIIRYIDSIKNGWRKFPPSLHIELTDHCFNKCIMCDHWKRDYKTALNTQALIAFLENGKKKGLESVCLSGGDPFAYPGINDIMCWLSKNEIAYGIVTAGHVPYHISYSFIKKAKWVRVSLDATNNSDYKKCRGGAVSFDNIHNSVKHMNEYGVNVQFGITIHKHNIEDLEAIYLYANKHGSRTDARLVYDHAKKLSIRNDEIGDVKRLSKKYLVNFDDYSPTHIEVCYACLYQNFIRADGGIFPCCILAGDTQLTTAADVNLGSIYTNEMSWTKYFSCNRSDTVKKICNKLCIKRLDTINNTVHNKINERNFF